MLGEVFQSQQKQSGFPVVLSEVKPLRISLGAVFHDKFCLLPSSTFLISRSNVVKVWVSQYDNKNLPFSVIFSKTHFKIRKGYQRLIISHGKLSSSQSQSTIRKSRDS